MSFLSRPLTAMAALSGLGMALLSPNLMTVPSDACHPSWRATGMGVYRMWRGAGYAVGAVAIGLVVEFGTVDAAFTLTGVAMVLSALVVYAWMEEAHPTMGTHTPPGTERSRGRPAPRPAEVPTT